LLLGVDSLIACFAVGPLVRRRSWLPYALLNGACDGGGFLLGTAFHWSVPDGTANVVETAVFVLLGVYWIAIAVFSPKVVGTRWVWILPFVLSIDNISYGLIDHAWSHSVAVQAFQQFLATSVLAGIWFASESMTQIRVLITRHLRGFRHDEEGVFDDRGRTFAEQ
jgi:hypothetical protein